MNKQMTYIAGLTLAAALTAPPLLAQQPSPPAPGTLPREGQIDHVEVVTRNEDGPLGVARDALGDAANNIRSIFTTGESTEHPLIITSSQPDEKSIATLDEDLNIMARVLAKSIEHGADESERKALGIQLWTFGGARNPRNLYIDGYGAIFMLNVNIPLLAPPSKPQVEDKKEETSSTWEEARNELYGRNEGRSQLRRFRIDRRAGPPFDADRVEELKKDLTEALKNATHIRGLKNDDHVTIVVQGAGSNANVGHVFKYGTKGELEQSDVFGLAGAGTGGGRSVMTLRAKKSDIDAFAKGKTELDDFRKKVSISVYQTPGGGSGSALMMRPE
jgi:hypothetical protein